MNERTEDKEMGLKYIICAGFAVTGLVIVLLVGQQVARLKAGDVIQLESELVTAQRIAAERCFAARQKVTSITGSMFLADSLKFSLLESEMLQRAKEERPDLYKSWAIATDAQKVICEGGEVEVRRIEEMIEKRKGEFI